MIAKLIKNSDDCYYCSECRMKQTELEPYCFFCGANFSNYEEELIKIFSLAEDE